MILLAAERFPKSGKFFIIKLTYRMINAVHCRRSKVIMSAGTLNTADKADVALG